MAVSVHLIHIGDAKERRRAIEIFLEVPETWASFPGHVLGVTSKHLDALRLAQPPVEFEPAKKEHVNGKGSPV